MLFLCCFLGACLLRATLSSAFLATWNLKNTGYIFFLSLSLESYPWAATVSRTDWHCFFNCPERASCKEGYRQAPGWCTRAPTPPKQHLQPEPSGASPAEQWAYQSEAGRVLAWAALTLPGWRRSPWPRTLYSMWTSFCRFSCRQYQEMVTPPLPCQALCILCKRTDIASPSEEENSSEKTSLKS